MYWNPIVRGTNTNNPYTPYKNTTFKGLISYLLKIHFSAIRVILLNTIDATSNKIPISCVDALSPPSPPSAYSTATNCTLVMPRKAMKHPRTAPLWNTRLRKQAERRAVVMILPPLEICQTELSTILRAV